jgi:hypothetical protein
MTWCQREEAREQLLFLGGDVFLVTPLTEKLVTQMKSLFFRKIKCATLRDELKFILRIQFNNNKQKLPRYYGYPFLENFGIFRIWHSCNPISGTQMFSSMMPSQIERCVHTN